MTDGRRECRTATGRPKLRFDTRAEAKEVVRRSPGRLAGLVPYRCRVCGYFHLGHYTSNKRSRRDLRRRHRQEPS